MKLIEISRFLFVVFALCIGSLYTRAQQGMLISTDNNQKQLLKTFRFILEQSADDFQMNGVAVDQNLFPAYGEKSIYWVAEGANKGSFVIPGTLPQDYSSLKGISYTNYDWQSVKHYAVQFKKDAKRIAIFKSKYTLGNTSLTWEAMYFERLFSEYLMDDIYYFVNEDDLTGDGLDLQTQLLIIPGFVVKDNDYSYYIDSIFAVTPNLKNKVDAFLSRGGSIYAENNGAYFIEKLEYLESGAITYSSSSPGEALSAVMPGTSSGVSSFGFSPSLNSLYGNNFPILNSTHTNNYALLTSSGSPVIFDIKPAFSAGGKIICNTGMPTVYGLSNPVDASLQIGWTMSAILSAFTSEVDVTRKVKNVLSGAISAGDNAVSFDRADTIEVQIIVRNLSEAPISGISIEENIKNYFTFLDVNSGDPHTISGHKLVFSGLSLAAHTQQIITYRVITPGPKDPIHEDAEKYIDKGNLMAVSINRTRYTKDGYSTTFKKDKDYADILFSALIFADTDVNWKNFLGLYYQPFKVFMIMENKSRTAAENTIYTQYIPKDVPFYWTDNSINIPILKTPSGKFVTVLKGSNDQSNPEYDMDSDGNPDAWLDTASIFPKGYVLTEEAVYWANPWNHLRTGDPNFYFEDIDKDGLQAIDNNGDGIVDVEEPGDTIRVWKVTWDIGRVEGYEFHDPYCSYEVWVDPPDLVPLSAGVGYVYDSLPNAYPEMFYPYSDIATASKTDTSWACWMEHDNNGDVIWKQLVHQKINNYEGFTFIDTADANYRPLPTDSIIGTVPQPHREFIAVLSLGGEEIDMENYTPKQSLYSKIDYKTIFGEDRVTPIRTTYTYWAPLPNPLQFEYLSNNYQVFDTLNNVIQELPEYGPARLVFDMDASTEYTYYWIRNMGYDVDYNDPSETIDGVESYGDGVFGYFVYSIPKGMGGYQITLPRKVDGSYDIDAIVQIDGQPFKKWIDNAKTKNNVEIWETPFEYQVYIPQLLIPAALDDDNYDGVDDWIDDKGDRFSSKTGFLHDAFMPGDGEDYPNKPATPFEDVGYGNITSGWDIGSDNANGDDYFEDLGKTHITINADYMGRGREGSVEISKGGVLVCEEIFGGSPWVIFSHVLSGFAQGTDVSVESQVIPETVYYGIDTVYLKHVISDTNEPHNFDINFDPYHVSYGYGKSTITTFVGAKDPCILVEPAISMPAILDPGYDNQTITLVPEAKSGNSDLTNYPRSVEGTFLEVRVEVNNSTADNWVNTTVIPQIPSELGTTSVEMQYVSYPRPLVPAFYDPGTGKIIAGDQPGTFTTGWRFNQPEGEQIIKMGNVQNLIQPTRRAYFVFLFKIDPNLANGIYQIPFTISGSKIHYDKTNNGTISYEVPTALFSIADKDANGNVTGFQKIILSQSALKTLDVSSTENFKSTGRIKWSNTPFGQEEFEAIPSTLTANGEGKIDLSKIKRFPTLDTAQLVILQEGIVDSYNTDAEILRLTNGQTLNYSDLIKGNQQVTSDRLLVKPVGPRIRVKNTVYSINGVLITDSLVYESDKLLYIKTLLTAKNTGSDISSQTNIQIFPGEYYTVLVDSLDANCSFADGLLTIRMGDIIPGEMKEQLLPFVLNPENLPEGIDIRTIIEQSEIDYEGTLIDRQFNFTDTNKLLLDLYDFEATSISYNDNGNGTVTVTANAGNRGIYGKDVWFRIYPIIGGGVYEFPIEEREIFNFVPGQQIELKGTYTLPVDDKSIDFIAIVDDGQDYTEITELNNSIKIPFVATSTNTAGALQNNLIAFPVPFADNITFDYVLSELFATTTLEIYDLQGKMWVKIENCPTSKGKNSISWRNSDMPDGSYIYLLKGQVVSGVNKVLYSGEIIKSIR